MKETNLPESVFDIVTCTKYVIIGHINEGVNMWLLAITMAVLWTTADSQDRKTIIDNTSGYKMERAPYVILI